jgi:transposase
VDHQVVRRWLERFLEHGIDGLKDQRRAGRPPIIDPLVWQKVATIVVQLPSGSA